MTDERSWLTDDYWLSEYNWAPEVREQFDLPDSVRIHDVTLRESMQSPRVTMNPEEKIHLARQLSKLGVYSIENGAYMSDVEREVTTELVRLHKAGEIKPEITPLVHVSNRDIDIALQTGADRVLISQSINPWSHRHFYGTTEEELIAKLTGVVSYAKSNGLFVTAQIYDTYRAPLPFLERAVKTLANDGGVDQIAISDTRGFALPWTVTYLVKTVRSWVPHTPIEHHGHNDYGLATAMMLSAVAGGAQVVHTSVNSIGERVGNAATEEVAMALELLLGVHTGVHLEHISDTCEMVAQLTKHPIARNKPIIGENMFMSGSGQVYWRHKQLSRTDRPMADCAFSPAVIGRDGDGLEPVLGVGAGKTIVAEKLDALKIEATKEQMTEIALRVKAEAYITKWTLSDAQFKAIVHDVLAGE